MNKNKNLVVAALAAATIIGGAGGAAIATHPGIFSASPVTVYAADEKAAQTAADAPAAAQTNAANAAFSNTKELTSKNGVLTITVPEDGEWKEVSSSTGCVTFSDGDDTIVFTHCKNADGVPDVKKVDAPNVKTFQEITGNADFYMSIAGYSVEPQDREYEVMVSAIKSAVIHEDKIDNTDHSTATSQFSVRDVNETMYVTASSLCVRTEGNQNSKAIGNIDYASAVQVTGVVQKDGKDINWVRIKFNSITGYVCSDFLSTNKPATQAKAPAPTKAPTPASTDASVQKSLNKRTGDYLPLYDEYNNEILIYEYDDGTWFDDDGIQYYEAASQVWTDGSSYYYTVPQTSIADEETVTEYMNLYTIYGECIRVHSENGGDWYDDYGVSYYYMGDGRYGNNSGTVYFTSMSDAMNATDVVPDSTDDGTNYDDGTIIDDGTNYDDGTDYDDGSDYVETYEEPVDIDIYE